MAIIECPSCKELMNETESVCPNCGTPRVYVKSKNNQNKSFDISSIFKNMTKGRIVAIALGVVCVALIVLCVLILLGKNGTINFPLADKLKFKEKAPKEVTCEVLDTYSFGRLESCDEKDNTFYCEKDGYSVKVPVNFGIYEEEGDIFFCEKLEGSDTYAIPYVMIKKESDETDPVAFLQSWYNLSLEAYDSQNFTLTENLVSYEEGARTVYEFAFKYTNPQGYEILDVRRAIEEGGAVYMIATKELSDESLVIGEETISNMLTSFKLISNAE